VDFLVGYKATRVDDSFSVDQRTVSPLGTVTFHDVFDVHNEFHGGEVGLMADLSRGPFTLSMLGKLGMGNMHQEVNIFGRNTVTISPDPTQIDRGGLLALPTNDGTHTHNEFSIVPEAEFKVTCRITERWEASIGYSFIYWSGIALAGQQIPVAQDGTKQPMLDRRQILNSSPPPGADHPKFPGVRDTDFWLHGLTIGIGFRR
jgi:hypothetical protein